MVYQQVDLETLLARLADRYEGVPFWTSPDGISGLQWTLRWWQLFTAQWKTRVIVPTVAATSFPTGWIYTTPTTPTPIVSILRASYAGIPLKPASRVDLDLGYRNWRSQTIASSGAPRRPTFWTKLALNRFAIWPADTGVGNPLEIDGTTCTPILAVDPTNPSKIELETFIDLGAEEEPIILDEALHAIAYKLGGTYWKRTFEGHQRFLKAAVDRNARLKAETAFREVMGLDQATNQRPYRRTPSAEAMQTLQED